MMDGNKIPSRVTNDRYTKFFNKVCSVFAKSVFI